MNILFICNEFPPYPSGGIGIFTSELATELVKSGNTVFVVGLYPIEKRIKEEFFGIKIIRLPRKKGIIGTIKSRFLLYRELKNIIEKNKIDILETPDFNGLLAFFPKLNCKIVTRLHGSVYYFRKLTNNKGVKGYLWYLIEKSSIKKSDKIISVSKFTSNYTKEIFNIKSDIFTLYNGVKVDVSYVPKKHYNKNKSFIFAGSLIRKKGIIELINAWIDFSILVPNATLDIYGKNIESLAEFIKEQAKKNNCHSINIYPPISKNELQKKYISADFCIFPTKAEAFSLAPMEAMAMSKVVLYTNQTSAEELICNNINGILITKCTHDSILDSLKLANTLTIDEYNKIALNAFNTINEKFNVRKKNIENIEFYQRLIYNDN
ncbi:TPA: glycosyltransferase family 4 protein [Escherichia coli]|nr:glycosyltransferase family 4 protein [Escherichia coli]